MRGKTRKLLAKYIATVQGAHWRRTKRKWQTLDHITKGKKTAQMRRMFPHAPVQRPDQQNSEGRHGSK